MRKEIQAAEWLLLLAGLLLLGTGSRYFTVFARLFEAYFFLVTAGMGLWMMSRHLNRSPPKNRSIFKLLRPDESHKHLSIKAIQLSIIVTLCIWQAEEFLMIIPVAISLLFFRFQLARYGQPKIVFQGPDMYWDAIFFEHLEVWAFDIYTDGITIQSEPPRSVAFGDLQTSPGEKEATFVDNQLLDDVMLHARREENTQQFLREVEEYAKKMKIPIQRQEREGLFKSQKSPKG